VGSGEWEVAEAGGEELLIIAQCPMPNNYFVFLILFNCDAKIFEVFANLYYLIW
jgi:hypothetical protein